VWRRRQKSHPELQALYDSKLILVEKMLTLWVERHPEKNAR